MFCFDEIFL